MSHTIEVPNAELRLNRAGVTVTCPHGKPLAFHIAETGDLILVDDTDGHADPLECLEWVYDRVVAAGRAIRDARDELRRAP